MEKVSEDALRALRSALCTIKDGTDMTNGADVKSAFGYLAEKVAALLDEVGY